MFAVKETLSLCGLAGFFCEYVPVFLAGKNVYRIIDFKRGLKIEAHKTCANCIIHITKEILSIIAQR